MSGYHRDPETGRRRFFDSRVVLAVIGLLAILAVIGVFLVQPRGKPGAHHAAGSPGSSSGSSGVPSLSASAGASGRGALSHLSASPSASASPSPRPKTTSPASGVSGFEAAVVNLVNQQRAQNGCRALNSDSRLAKAARGHSADMAARGYFDHTTPDGVSFSARITAAGYRWSAAAENIASGQPDPASVMNAWMNSPGHRANILNCAYRDIGVGLAYDSRRTPFWTQDFGTPA